MVDDLENDVKFYINLFFFLHRLTSEGNKKKKTYPPIVMLKHEVSIWM